MNQNVKLAEDMKFEDYANIDSFGKQMLYGMGWKDDQAIGDSNKGPIKPVEFKLRSHRAGLGSEGAFPDDKKQKNKNKKKKLRERSRSKEKQQRKKRHKEKTDRRIENNEDLVWGFPSIIVRVVDDKSKYFKQKAVVTDIIDTCTYSLMTLEDKVIHTDFNEEDIETVIPKLGENVIILKKSKRGKVAKLLERDKKENRVQVQILDNLEIISYTQDDISAIQNIN